jgi:tetratricopeptide (TPR) repeat protein
MKYAGLALLAVCFITFCTPSNTEASQNANSSNYESELKKLTQELLEDPQNASLHYSRALVHTKYQHFEEAIVDAQLAMRYDSTKAEYALALVDAYFYQNQTRKAKDLLLNAKNRYKNPEIHLKLAELYLWIRSYQEAINEVNTALKMDEHLAQAYFIKANIYRESGDTLKSISSYETALDQNPQMDDARFDLALIYAAQSNPLALTYLEQVLRNRPNDTTAQYAYAYSLQQLGQFDKAVLAYEALTQKASGYGDAFYNLGALRFAISSCKDLKKALSSFTRAIQIQPQMVRAYLARACVYKELNNSAAAIADYEFCLQLDPSNTEAAKSLNELKK